MIFILRFSAWFLGMICISSSLWALAPDSRVKHLTVQEIELASYFESSVFDQSCEPLLDNVAPVLNAARDRLGELAQVGHVVSSIEFVNQLIGVNSYEVADPQRLNLSRFVSFLRQYVAYMVQVHNVIVQRQLLKGNDPQYSERIENAVQLIGSEYLQAKRFLDDYLVMGLGIRDSSHMNNVKVSGLLKDDTQSQLIKVMNLEGVNFSSKAWLMRLHCDGMFSNLAEQSAPEQWSLFPMIIVFLDQVPWGQDFMAFMLNFIFKGFDVKKQGSGFVVAWNTFLAEKPHLRDSLKDLLNQRPKVQIWQNHFGHLAGLTHKDYAPYLEPSWLSGSVAVSMLTQSLKHSQGVVAFDDFSAELEERLKDLKNKQGRLSHEQAALIHNIMSWALTFDRKAYSPLILNLWTLVIKYKDLFEGHDKFVDELLALTMEKIKFEQDLDQELLTNMVLIEGSEQEHVSDQYQMLSKIMAYLDANITMLKSQPEKQSEPKDLKAMLMHQFWTSLNQKTSLGRFASQVQEAFQAFKPLAPDLWSLYSDQQKGEWIETVYWLFQTFDLDLTGISLKGGAFSEFTLQDKRFLEGLFNLKALKEQCQQKMPSAPEYSWFVIWHWYQRLNDKQQAALLGRVDLRPDAFSSSQTQESGWFTELERSSHLLLRLKAFKQGVKEGPSVEFIQELRRSVQTWHGQLRRFFPKNHSHVQRFMQEVFDFLARHNALDLQGDNDFMGLIARYAPKHSWQLEAASVDYDQEEQWWPYYKRYRRYFLSVYSKPTAVLNQTLQALAPKLIERQQSHADDSDYDYSPEEWMMLVSIVQSQAAETDSSQRLWAYRKRREKNPDLAADKQEVDCVYAHMDQLESAELIAVWKKWPGSQDTQKTVSKDFSWYDFALTVALAEFQSANLEKRQKLYSRLNGYMKALNSLQNLSDLQQARRAVHQANFERENNGYQRELSLAELKKNFRQTASSEDAYAKVVQSFGQFEQSYRKEYDKDSWTALQKSYEQWLEKSRLALWVSKLEEFASSPQKNYSLQSFSQEDLQDWLKSPKSIDDSNAPAASEALFREMVLYARGQIDVDEDLALDWPKRFKLLLSLIPWQKSSLFYLQAFFDVMINKVEDPYAYMQTFVQQLNPLQKQYLADLFEAAETQMQTGRGLESSKVLIVEPLAFFARTVPRDLLVDEQRASLPEGERKKYWILAKSLYLLLKDPKDIQQVPARYSMDLLLLRNYFKEYRQPSLRERKDLLEEPQSAHSTQSKAYKVKREEFDVLVRLWALASGKEVGEYRDALEDESIGLQESEPSEDKIPWLSSIPEKESLSLEIFYLCKDHLGEFEALKNFNKALYRRLVWIEMSELERQGTLDSYGLALEKVLKLKPEKRGGKGKKNSPSPNALSKDAYGPMVTEKQRNWREADIKGKKAALQTYENWEKGLRGWVECIENVYFGEIENLDYSSLVGPIREGVEQQFLRAHSLVWLEHYWSRSEYLFAEKGLLSILQSADMAFHVFWNIAQIYESMLGVQQAYLDTWDPQYGQIPSQARDDFWRLKQRAKQCYQELYYIDPQELSPAMQGLHELLALKVKALDSFSKYDPQTPSLKPPKVLVPDFANKRADQSLIQQMQGAMQAIWLRYFYSEPDNLDLKQKRRHSGLVWTLLGDKLAKSDLREQVLGNVRDSLVPQGEDSVTLDVGFQKTVEQFVEDLVSVQRQEYGQDRVRKPLMLLLLAEAYGARYLPYHGGGQEPHLREHHRVVYLALLQKTEELFWRLYLDIQREPAKRTNYLAEDVDLLFLYARLLEKGGIANYSMLTKVVDLLDYKFQLLENNAREVSKGVDAYGQKMLVRPHASLWDIQYLQMLVAEKGADSYAFDGKVWRKRPWNSRWKRAKEIMAELTKGVSPSMHVENHFKLKNMLYGAHVLAEVRHRDPQYRAAMRQAHAARAAQVAA